MANMAAPNRGKSREAGRFTKRIGYTTYLVGVYFSISNNEAVRDKIMRLVKNEAQDGKEVDKE